MRSSRLVALTSFGCALALLAFPAGAAIKKASTAECAGLIDVFRNKPGASVKDEAITEYAPLVKTYWQKGCAPDLYNQQIDPPLRARIEAIVPQPKAKKAPAKKTS
jgi:hypothetical protein